MGFRILIVEDDTAFGTMLCKWAEKNGFEATLANRTADARERLEEGVFDLVLTDMRLPDGDGIMLLTWIRERKSPPPVMIMTGYADVRTAVSAIKLGAVDYLEKPINPAILKEKIEQALASGRSSEPQSVREHRAHRPAATEGGAGAGDMVEGNAPAARKLFEHIRLVAPTKLSVLIEGESGTGKEYAARAIHRFSKRCGEPFFAVDCGSLSRELAPSELFGHLKGSFTSAVADKKGVFEMACGGTVFLDEVGNLSTEVQVQLLRALQEMRIRPVGAARDVEIDVRIIVATNEDLRAAIGEGRFREDLYHRLNEFSLTVPPLRERTEDIGLFVEHFVAKANGELDKSIKGVSDEALAALCRYRWRGNLRELKNVIRRSALFTTGALIEIGNLPEFLFEKQPDAVNLLLRPGNEREQIEAALAAARGNKSAAAKLLGIDRKTLYNKMHTYGMEI